MNPISAPALDVDLYCDEEILDPYPTYDRLRELGPAVFIPTLNLWAVTRYKDVKDILRNPEGFCSSHGVTSNDRINEVFLVGTTLTTDGPEHFRQKKVMTAPLVPLNLDRIRNTFKMAADQLVEQISLNTRIDAISELSQYLPLTIVSNLVGIPDEGRERMLEWAAAVFNVIGSDNERSRDSMPALGEAVAYANEVATRDTLRPESWGALIYEAAERGDIGSDQIQSILLDYLLPSLDTTISATSTLLHMFGLNPDQWRLLRSNPSLMSGAIAEAVRLESPIRGFTRYVTRQHRFEEGVVVPAGARVLLLYGAANRDPRKYEDPAAFRIQRAPSDHLGFGHGSHACAGQHLAKLEMNCLLDALVRRVERFEVHRASYVLNNSLRGLAELEVTLH